MAAGTESQVPGRMTVAAGTEESEKVDEAYRKGFLDALSPARAARGVPLVLAP